MTNQKNTGAWWDPAKNHVIDLLITTLFGSGYHE